LKNIIALIGLDKRRRYDEGQVLLVEGLKKEDFQQKE
jgi:hypothetical protein